MLHFHVRQAEAKAEAEAEVDRQSSWVPQANADGNGKTVRDISQRGAENFAGEFRQLTCCGSDRKKTAASRWLWLDHRTNGAKRSYDRAPVRDEDGDRATEGGTEHIN